MIPCKLDNSFLPFPHECSYPLCLSTKCSAVSLRLQGVSRSVINVLVINVFAPLPHSSNVFFNMFIVHHDVAYTRAYPVIIAAAIATTWSVMVFCVRIYLRLSMKRSFGADDVACAVGMVRECLWRCDFLIKIIETC